LQARWEELRRRLPGDLACPAAQVQSWHQREALQHWINGELKDARAVLDRAVAAWPEDLDLRAQRSTLAFDTKDWATALDAALRVAARRPHYWRNVAEVYSRSQRQQEGVRLLSGRLEAHSQNHFLWWARGKLHLELGRWQLALDDLTRAQTLGAGDAV